VEITHGLVGDGLADGPKPWWKMQHKGKREKTLPEIPRALHGTQNHGGKCNSKGNANTIEEHYRQAIIVIKKNSLYIRNTLSHRTAERDNNTTQEMQNLTRKGKIGLNCLTRDSDNYLVLPQQGSTSRQAAGGRLRRSPQLLVEQS